MCIDVFVVDWADEYLVGCQLRCVSQEKVSKKRVPGDKMTAASNLSLQRARSSVVVVVVRSGERREKGQEKETVEKKRTSSGGVIRDKILLGRAGAG